MKYQRIYVVCQRGSITGGPESLHLLCKELRSLGHDSNMVYYPFSENINDPINVHYKSYNVPASSFNDEVGALFIFPETLPIAALNIKNAKSAIWWLSLDNFLENRYQNKFLNKLRYLWKVSINDRPLLGIRSLKNLIHFSKAHYDHEFLKKKGLNPYNLPGPISKFFTDAPIKGKAPISERNDFILYNPRKGFKLTSSIIKNFPQYTFKAVENLSEPSLQELFLKSKLYIDFGHHPGKERMPREAAINGCCIITNTKGSAQNDFDIPIPHKFKLDERDPQFLEKLANLLKDILNNYEEITKEFEKYREVISNENDKLIYQLKKYFG